MPRLTVAACAVLLCGCSATSAPVGLLPESFPPQGVAFSEYEAPDFPYRLKPTAITRGYCVLAVTVDEGGRVEDAVGLEATDPAFVEAVLEVMPSWVFAPTATSASQPRREIMHFQFRRSGVVSQSTHRDAGKSMFAEADERYVRVRTVAWEDVDRAPVRLSGGPPGTFSRDLVPQGGAELSFIIDQAGRVRVPVVVGTTDPALGEAALGAIKEWRFSPPTRRGQPVLVEVHARLGE